MLRNGTENKYESPFSEPHKILKVNTNGTVRLRVSPGTDTVVNIRRIEPFKHLHLQQDKVKPQKDEVLATHRSCMLLRDTEAKLGSYLASGWMNKLLN
jgi:hypothetical protein